MVDSISDDDFDSGLDDAILLAAAAEAENAAFDDFDDSLLLKAVELTDAILPQQQASNHTTADSIGNSQRQYQTTVDRFFSQSSPASSSRGSSSVGSSGIQSNLPTARQDTGRNPFQTTLSAPAPQAPPPPPAEDTPCAHFFDPEACTTWVYPINYPLRTYQFNIVQRALFNNTLVAMPTGLGKTFIAAVVMYNYFRWFPTAKIVFMAPTKPLVNQQIEACFNICGVPQDQTAELTGAMPPAKRRLLWNSKRLFFITPQVLQNDLNDDIFPVDRLACLVVDEAHKATGGYAYAVAVRKIKYRHKDFRILALTATPGTSLQAVQKIVDNLLISNIQIRTEDSLDIQEFSHGKSIQTVVVSLTYTHGGVGMLPKAISTFRESVFMPVLKSLNQFKAINDMDPDRNSPYMLMQSRGIWQTHSKSFNKAVQNTVFSNFLAADILSRAHDLLCQHGTGPFLRSMKSTIKEIQVDLDAGKHVNKAKLNIARNPDLQKLLRDLDKAHEQPDYVGHPKMDRLLSSVLQHLTGTNQTEANGDPNAQTRDTRIMVFSSLRESVTEIVNFLSRHEPIVRCTSFVGQAESKGSKGLNQKEQQEVISKFKRGVYNVIVSTSIGEEGLDIGEVDLIICYDSQSSPIRMIQRLGRTGRKRKGNCILLLTESENRKYNQAKDNYKRVQDMISRRDAINYYPHNPVILPGGIRPAPDKVVLNIGEYQKQQSGKRKRNGIVDQFCDDGTLGESQEEEFRRRYLQPLRQIQQSDSNVIDEWMHHRRRLAENKYTPLQTTLSSSKIPHSYRSVQFVALVSKMERRIVRGLTGDRRDECDDDLEDGSGMSGGNTLLLPRRQKGRKTSDTIPSVPSVDPVSDLKISPHRAASPPPPQSSHDSGMEDNNTSVQYPEDMDMDIALDPSLYQPSPPRITETSMTDTCNINSVERIQDDAHDKPSFIFVPPEDSCIFGNHVMESPIKQASHQRFPEKRKGAGDTFKISDHETASDTRFAFNDQMVPIFAFEMKNRIRPSLSAIPEHLSWLSDDPQYSAKAREIVVEKWRTLYNSGEHSLQQLDKALRNVILEEQQFNVKLSQPPLPRDTLSLFGWSRDEMQFDEGDTNSKQISKQMPNAARVEDIEKDRCTTETAHQEKDEDDDFEFDLGELELDDSTELLINRGSQREPHFETHVQPTSVAIVTHHTGKKDIPSSVEQGLVSPADSIIDSQDDSFEFDLADLDLTMLENKIDMEGGYAPAERSPPFRPVHNLPDIITLSSDSDASSIGDYEGENNQLAGSQTSYKSQTINFEIPATPAKQIRYSQTNNAIPAKMDHMETVNPLTFHTSDTHSSSHDVEQSMVNSQPITRRNIRAKRQRVLYSSPTENSASSPIRPLPSEALVDTIESRTPPRHRNAIRSHHSNGAQFRKRNPFFDLEASESGEGASSDADEEERSSFLDSFIDDNTITSKSVTESPRSNLLSPPNMYAVYRQSLISPDQKERAGISKNIFNNTTRPRYLQRVLDNLGYANEEDDQNEQNEQNSESYTSNSEQLTSEAFPESQVSIASAAPEDGDDSDFM